MAADHLFELDADLLGEGSALEGHPDNVAAALHGGFVICAEGEVARFDAPSGLEALAVVPTEAVRTRAARAALTPEVLLQDAVFNVAHGALLTLGLARGDWDLVAVVCRTTPHQQRLVRPPVPALIRAGAARLARWARWGRRSRGRSDRAGVVLLRADGRRGADAQRGDRGVGESAAHALRAAGRLRGGDVARHCPVRPSAAARGGVERGIAPAGVGRTSTVMPGATISLSMRSRSAVSSCTSAAPSWDSSCSMVRGPMIAAVTAGWLMTNASARWISVMSNT